MLADEGFCQTQASVTWEQGASVEELLPSDWPEHMSVGAVS